MTEIAFNFPRPRHVPDFECNTFLSLYLTNRYKYRLGLREKLNKLRVATIYPSTQLVTLSSTYGLNVFLFFFFRLHGHAG